LPQGVTPSLMGGYLIYLTRFFPSRNHSGAARPPHTFTTA
jgi:hypothetical protein